MLGWCALLFALGVLAFLDSIFNYGEIFRQINSVLFMLTSLGLLVRTTTKMRLRTFENQAARILALEEEVFSLRQQQPSSNARVTRESPLRTSV